MTDEKRAQAAARQRRRRARVKRIDYYPDAVSREILIALRTRGFPWNSPSLALNRIVREWSEQQAVAS